MHSFSCSAAWWCLLCESRIGRQKLQQLNTDNPVSDEHKHLSKMGICKLYFRMMYKMRNVYSSFIVHIEESGEDIVQHVDPTVMAYCGVTVLAVHKISLVHKRKVLFVVFWYFLIY